METRKAIIGLVLFSLIIISVSFASAEFWACFDYGQKIDWCGVKPDTTCDNKNGCEKCMSDSSHDGCYNVGNYNMCNQIDQTCTVFNGSTELDTKSPGLIINSPVQNEVYDTRSILLDIEVDEESDIYYYDNINGRGRWTNVCKNCYGYDNKRSFAEGINNITFKAVDVLGNENTTIRIFTVDSKKPKIKKTEPKKGFADGNFEIQFQEANPKSLVLHYGNIIAGYGSVELNLEECTPYNPGSASNDKFTCNTYVDLKVYDGQEIDYWAVLTDIADVSVESKHLKLDVDTTAPVLNNNNSFYAQGTGKNSKYIYFTFNVTEENFDSIEYYDYNDRNPRWRSLCTRLKDGICEKKVSFSKGNHAVDIQIMDEAG
ncbi:MAG: hypothetical protein KKA64_00175, partial [Nanoarchaeota archaeon]|nr:hypothetical protein [Nanoarchaeota archaeon]